MPKRNSRKDNKKKGEYVLGLKGNQGGLYEEVKRYFEEEGRKYSVCETVDGEHGRIETRKCWVTEDIEDIKKKNGWEGLRSIVMVKSKREIGEKVSEETRYFISSLAGEAKKTLKAVRSHWGIENGLHYVLDVSFNEDKCRINTKNGAENFAILRHIALNLLKQEKTAKNGIKAKRMKAGWDEQYLLKVLTI